MTTSATGLPLQREGRAHQRSQPGELRGRRGTRRAARPAQAAPWSAAITTVDHGVEVGVRAAASGKSSRASRSRLASVARDARARAGRAALRRYAPPCRARARPADAARGSSRRAAASPRSRRSPSRAAAAKACAEVVDQRGEELLRRRGHETGLAREVLEERALGDSGAAADLGGGECARSRARRGRRGSPRGAGSGSWRSARPGCAAGGSGERPGGRGRVGCPSPQTTGDLTK